MMKNIIKALTATTIIVAMSSCNYISVEKRDAVSVEVTVEQIESDQFLNVETDENFKADSSINADNALEKAKEVAKENCKPKTMGCGGCGGCGSHN